MVDAAPFTALRYDPAIAGDPASTSAPAYDDVERFTYARHRTASPYTVLELLAGEDAAPDAYRGAAGTFRRWRRTGVLAEDAAPAFYIYEIHELRSGVPTMLRGVLAAVAVQGDTLLPHEAVHPDRVAARVRRMEAVPADLAPVFAVHQPGPPSLRQVLDAPPSTRPIVAFTDEAGADHRVWALREPDAVEAVRSGLSEIRAVIADGHHRFAAAAQRAALGNGATDRTLTYLVDATMYGPHLHPVHRLVAAPDTAALLHRLDGAFELQPVASGDLATAAAAAGDSVVFGLHVGGGPSGLLVARDGTALRSMLPSGHSPSWTKLDAAVWEHAVRPLLGDAPVVYRADGLTARREADAGGGALFLLRPPVIDDVFACAFAGEALPPKSTWFRPKPRAGLVLRSLDSPR